jgi:hypothetical protein
VTRLRWIALAVLGAPVLVGATVVSATFGPLGALAYGGLLLGGLNARHLFHTHRDDARTTPIRIIRERLHR